MTIWTMTEARRRFSEVVRRTEIEGPQAISRRGVIVAIFATHEDWERHQASGSERATK
jgi:prevent-host-death family protein